MKLRIFTFRFDVQRGGFDDKELRELAADAEVLSVSEHFFIHEQVPTWALLVSYRELRRPGDPGEPGEPGLATGRRRDWRVEMAEEHRPLFDEMRKWRNERAKREGRPPYVLLTNRQLAEIARARPTSLAALRDIQGFGESKASAMGDELLALVASIVPSLSTGPEPGEQQGPGGDVEPEQPHGAR